MFATGNGLSGQKLYYVLPLDSALWADMELEACLYLLTQEYNWRQVGTTTIKDAAEAFSEAFDGIFTLPNPAGMIIPYGGQPTAVPIGALACDGSSYLVADYPALFAVIGHTFGGVGANFNVPDMRSNVPLGVGGSVGGSPTVVGGIGGEQTHTLTEPETPILAHTITPHTHGYVEPIVTPSLVQAGAGISDVPTPSVTSSANDGIANHGGGGAHNNMQPYLVTSYIILTGQ